MYNVTMINKNELLFVVDENNNPIEPKPRQEVHQKGYWHRVSHIWVVNSKGQILCQRRSLLKDSSPGKWESFFGGHLGPGVDYLDGARRELREELGLDLPADKFTFLTLYRREAGKEYQAVYFIKWDGDMSSIQVEEEEIDQLKWYDRTELESILLEEKDPNWTHMGYEKLVVDYLNRNYQE